MSEKISCRILAHAFATIVYNNGKCPLCGKQIAIDNKLSLDDVERHILENNEIDRYRELEKEGVV